MSLIAKPILILLCLTQFFTLSACHANDSRDRSPETSAKQLSSTAGFKISRSNNRFNLDIQQQSLQHVLQRLAEIADIELQANFTETTYVSITSENLSLEQAIAQLLTRHYYSLEKPVQSDSQRRPVLRVSEGTPIQQYDSRVESAELEAKALLYQRKLANIERLEDKPTNEAIAMLILAAQDEQLAVRLSAIEQLKNISHPGATEILLSLIDDSDTLIVIQTIVALSQSDDTAVIPAIEASLQHPQLEVQLAALEVLSNFAATTSLAAISALSTHDNPKVRFKVIQALGEIGTDETIPFLRQALGDADPSVRRLSRAILDELNDFKED